MTAYFLPMMFIVAAVEGYGLVTFGDWQPAFHQIKKLSVGEAVVFEILQAGLWMFIALACAYFVKALGETFHGKHNYRQAFTVVCHGLSPLFLFRLLDVFPHVNPWIPYAIGILLVAKALYHGVPLVMQPDPPHAFGFFLMTFILILMSTALTRFVTAWYLMGHAPALERFISSAASYL